MDKQKQNTDEKFMQRNEDAQETYSIWCFNRREAGAYGQSSLMLLFSFLFFGDLAFCSGIVSTCL